MPTKAEIAEHYPLHFKYRLLFAHCRAGKMRLAPHLCEPADRKKLGITLSLEYAFMGGEEADENIQPSVLIYDDDKDACWAIVIKAKTVIEQLVKYFKDVLGQSGHEGDRITVKLDQGHSIVALKLAVATVRSGKTIPVESPVGASQSSGRTEVVRGCSSFA